MSERVSMCVSDRMCPRASDALTSASQSTGPVAHDGAAWPSYTDEDIAAVTRVLRSGRVNYWTGNEVKSFEQEYAAWTGSSYAVALANGTVALDVALRALGIGTGDEVIVTPRTFLASVSSIVNSGATPVFADVCLDSQNITAATIEPLITKRTRAVVCVHLAGWPCEMDDILALTTPRKISIIEDCAQAHGARYRSRMVGTIGDIGAWSFCQDKIMSTGGEGGMVTTDNAALWSAMWSYKDHGKGWSAVHTDTQPPGFRWLHQSFGTNWRLTEMQAAIGRNQLHRIDLWSRRRQHYAQRIWSVAQTLDGLRVPSLPVHIQHAAYKCYVFVDPSALHTGWTRDRIIEEITQRGVTVLSGSCSEVYLERAFDGTGWRPATRLPNARELGETSLMFLIHPTLSEQDIERSCDVLESVMRLATRGTGAAMRPACRPAPYAEVVSGR